MTDLDSGVVISAADADDEPVLWLMLTYAASMGAGGQEQVAAARADPYLSCYVKDWGARRGDLGVVARGGNREPLGAAWLRLGGEGGSLKLGDSEVPELAMAVVPQARGCGVGSMMMSLLAAAARPHYPRIVLSVRDSNPAVVFYSRLGFRQTGSMTNRVGGDSLVMSLELSETAGDASAPG